jgi:demethoxyubiquinone hydroxylase (CLK1/Coq7/Cat5 family)
MKTKLTEITDNPRHFVWILIMAAFMLLALSGNLSAQTANTDTTATKPFICFCYDGNAGNIKPTSPPSFAYEKTFHVIGNPYSLEMRSRDIKEVDETEAGITEK